MILTRPRLLVTAERPYPRSFSRRWPESVVGQSRHFGRRPTTSGPPLETDIVRAGRHVSKQQARYGWRIKTEAALPLHLRRGLFTAGPLEYDCTRSTGTL
jgi:hypothetical protein